MTKFLLSLMLLVPGLTWSAGVLARQEDPEILKGTNLSQTVPSYGAGDWSPDGTKLWMRIIEADALKIQLYKVSDAGLTPLGTAILGHTLGWSPNDSKVWVHVDMGVGVNKIQLYNVSNTSLTPLGTAVPGWYAIWSPDGSKLWALDFVGMDSFLQLYNISDAGPMSVGSPILGEVAKWSPDGTKLFIRDYTETTIYFYPKLIESAKNSTGLKK